jgi:hypothetical protein
LPHTPFFKIYSQVIFLAPIKTALLDIAPAPEAYASYAALNALRVLFINFIAPIVIDKLILTILLFL